LLKQQNALFMLCDSKRESSSVVGHFLSDLSHLQQNATHVHVHDGIVEAAPLLLFELDPRDVSWLEVHGGRFQSCLGPTSNKHKTVSRGKRFADLAVGSPAAEAAIVAHALSLQSTVGASARFVSTVGSSNCIESM
jgi:hypothetical protein